MSISLLNLRNLFYVILFCNPAEGHEKGLVEGLVGWARRNTLVPVPHVDSLQELNLLLIERCRKYEGNHIKGRSDISNATN